MGTVMLSGRHLVLLGILACAGLLSVHFGQRQIELCYKLAAIEKELRDVRADIELCRIQHQALQSPKAVMTHAAELRLPVAPVTLTAPVLSQPAHVALAETAHSLGTAQGARRPQAPASTARPARDGRGQ
jgi:hypothetical protein